MQTSIAFTSILTRCRNTFLNKTADYGTSWRVYRMISIADQLYIKARRIRNIQEGILPQIDDSIVSEFEGIINYSVIGLMQLKINNEEPEELPVADVTRLYDEVIKDTTDLMQAKNNDYGEAWRDMSQEGMTDLILAKVLRIKQISQNKGETRISEGVDANLYDIMNYSTFALLLAEES